MKSGKRPSRDHGAEKAITGEIQYRSGQSPREISRIGAADGMIRPRSAETAEPKDTCRRLTRPSIGRFLLYALLASTVQIANGHQLKAAQTSVALSPATGLVEVIHRFYVHDAEHAVGQLGKLTGDIHRDAQLRNAFARYVAQRFTLVDHEGHSLPRVLVGTEIDGDFLWVYEEMPGGAWPRIAKVRHDSLQELWPEQENRVNVHTEGGLRTVVLRAGDGLQPLSAGLE